MPAARCHGSDQDQEHHGCRRDGARREEAKPPPSGEPRQADDRDEAGCEQPLGERAERARDGSRHQPGRRRFPGPFREAMDREHPEGRPQRQRHVERREATQQRELRRRHQDEAGERAGPASPSPRGPERHHEDRDQRGYQRDGTCSRFVHAEDGQRRDHEPVEGGRLVAIGRAVETRDDPLVPRRGGEHLPRHLRVPGLVGLVEHVAPDAPGHDEHRDQHDQCEDDGERCAVTHASVRTVAGR